MQQARTLVDIARDQAQRHPDKVLYRFLSDGHVVAATLSAGTLDQRARAIATWINAHSGAGKPLLLSFSPGMDFITAFWGCLYAGAIAAPVQGPSARRHRLRIHSLASDCSPLLGLTSTHSRLQLELPQMVWGVTSEITDTYSQEWRPNAHIQPQDVAYLQYTSGATSQPRGVVISHNNVLSNLEYIAQGFRFTCESVSATWLPHFHDMGLVYGILQPVFSDFSCVIIPPATFVRQPMCWLRCISAFRATHSGAPNFGYELVLRSASEEDLVDLDLSTWMVAFNGAEPVRASTLERFSATFAPYGFRRQAFCPAYGLAEATLKVTSAVPETGPLVRSFDGATLRIGRAVETDAEAGGARQLVSSGAPAGETSVVIIDPVKRTESAAGEIGEILVSGPGVARGYWRRESESRETFEVAVHGRPERLLRTGDLGMLHGGDLFVTGRLKELIIIHGQNFHPADLEATALSAHPVLSAGRAAAFSVEANDEEEVILVHELRRNALSLLEEMANSVRQSIAAEHGLSVNTVVFVARGRIPRTSSGKTQRNACREAYLAGKLDAIAVIKRDTLVSCDSLNLFPPEKETLFVLDWDERVALIERYLLSLIAEKSSTSSIPVCASDSAACYGIDSIAAASIQRRIETDLGLSLTFADLFSDMTIARLAGRLARQLDCPARLSNTEWPPIERSRRAEYPCSFEQERLWLLDQVEPGYCAHNILVGLAFDGELNAELLRRSLSQVTARHDPLRTRFGSDRGMPLQIVDVTEPIPFVIEDLTSCKETANVFNAIARREALAPFRLDTGPLARATLVRRSEGSHVLLITAHHIIIDGFSFGVLIRELVECYCALIENREPKLAFLPCRYGDFVEWWRDWVRRNTTAADLEYWRMSLAGICPDPVFPLDRPRPASPPLASSQEVFRIEQQLLDAVRSRCVSSHTTLFMVVAAAFACLLSRCSGMRDVVFGFPTSGRVLPELDTIAGQFAYPLVLRVDVPDDLRFSALLGRVRTAALNAYAHSSVPFAQIVQAAGSERRDGFNPLFRAIIGVLKDPIGTISLPGLTISTEDLPVACADSDVFLTLIEERNSLRGLFTYDNHIFDATTARALISSFVSILEQGVTDPGCCVSDLVLSPELTTRPQESPPPRCLPVIAVASTFTADPIESTLKFWAEYTSDYAELRFAPYNQVFQQLLDPRSLLSSDSNKACIVLVRFEDFISHPSNIPPGCTLESQIESNVREFIGAVRTFASRSQVPLIVCLCSEIEGQNSALFATWIGIVVGELNTVPGVHVLTPSEIARLYPVSKTYDRHGDDVAHIPLTHEQFTAVGTAVARKLASITKRGFKAIAVDCDQTLWKGVCGEDGAEGIEIDGPHAALHQFLLARREEGALLLLCSKNNPEDVDAVFTRRHDLLLRPEHFAAQRVSWQPKSRSLRELAAEIGIDVDSIVFLDDDAVECAEVRANCPEVLTIQLPVCDEQIPVALNHIWPLDARVISPEDRERAVFYRQNAERARCAEAAPLEEFLRQLQLTVKCSSATPEEYPRIAQLTQRTNQFNFTTRRWTEPRLAATLSNGLECITVRVEDRFGNYGLVGIVMFEVRGPVLVVDTFALSCRALGRRVEYRMLSRLGEIATERGAAIIELPLIRNAKNRPAQEFLNSVAAEFETAAPEGALFRFPASHALTLNFQPPAYSVPSPVREANMESGEAEAGIRWRRAAEQIPSAYSDVNAILATIRSRQAIRRSTAPQHSPPGNETERAIAQIWTDVLGVDDPGLQDNFFELGGHSLHAAQIVARIRERFQIEFPLKEFFAAAPTIQEISRAVEQMELEMLEPEQMAEFLAQLNYQQS